MIRCVQSPNTTSAFLLREMCACLASGKSVCMLFGGGSMRPLINGRSDKIMLRPVVSTNAIRKGKVYLFEYNGSYVIHRLLRVRGDNYLFRGDACSRFESVKANAVLGELVCVLRSDGRVVSCSSFKWKALSFLVSSYRSAANTLKSFFSYERRRRGSFIYFFLLAVLMWAPLNGLSAVLDNYLLGLRVDHLFHASAFIPCAFFLFDALRRRMGRVWLLSVAVGLCTETVQFFLPFRKFDINDMIANFLGATLGWTLICCYLFRKHKHLRPRT